jgi:hypothetical protein
MSGKSAKSKTKKIISSLKSIIKLTKTLKEKKRSDFNYQIKLDLEKYSREDIHLGI